MLKSLELSEYKCNERAFTPPYRALSLGLDETQLNRAMRLSRAADNHDDNAAGGAP